MVRIESINRINRKTGINTSFTGHNLSVNENGEKVYKFFIPKVNFNDAVLRVKKFQLDSNGNVDLSSCDDKEQEFVIDKNSAYTQLRARDLNLTGNTVLAYRFIIDGRQYNDKHRFIKQNGIVYNLADLVSSDVLQTPKSIYHLVPNVFNPKLKQQNVINALGETVFNDEKTARINHFMNFDSNINDIIAKIPYIKELGFRRILSSPIFGQDNISSHGYWTVNPFQINDKLGNMEDFKKLQIDLFKNSMGFIADGAFTDEGLNGIHMRDILRHGERSPFISWFNFHNFPARPIKLGILPDNKTAYDNFDIKLVNSPIIWNVTLDGSPSSDFGKKNPNYNPKKETYIQIYDRRLASHEQIKKDEVFNSYAIKNLNDKDEISSWMDSVLPYAFPINPKELEAKVKLVHKYGNNLPAKEFLKSWHNFELSTAKESGGVSLWYGNKDIPKLRFTFPVSKQEKILAEAKNYNDGIKEVKAAKNAVNQVQNYIFDVGQFWTNKTAKILREHVVSLFDTVGNANVQIPLTQQFKNIITNNAGIELPEALKNITETQIKNAIENNNRSINNLPYPESIEEALMEYPLEALEVSDDITSVFAYPEFKKLAGSVLYENSMKKAAVNILKKLQDKNISAGMLVDDGELNEDNARVVQLISDDIARFLLLKSLNPSLDVEDVTSYSDDSVKTLKNITAASVGLNYSFPQELEQQLVNIMKANLSKINKNDIDVFVDYLYKRIKDVTVDKINVANLVLDLSEAGFNWRIDAAKDIAEIESYVEDSATLQESWDEVKNFWKKFNAGVKIYNPHSYKIAEFTDTAISYTDVNNRNKNSGDLEQKFVEDTSFTTQSNYSYMFGMLQNYLSAMPEFSYTPNKDIFELLKEKLLIGWSGVPGYLYSGNKNNIAFSHVAVGNHDKQRISHTFAMNMALAYIDYNSWDECLKNEIRNDLIANSAFYFSKYYQDICNNNWTNVFSNISQQNLSKMSALLDAFNFALKKQELDQQVNDKYLADFTRILEKLSDRSNMNSKTFFYKTFEDNYADIINAVKDENSEFVQILRKIEPIVHNEFTRPAQIRGIELSKLMVALPGSPTLFAGDELLELGGEDKAKNVYLQNRNRIKWERLDDAKYAHIKTFNARLAEIFNLRNDKDLSCLVNGDTILLKKQKDLGYGRNLAGIYRYNDNDDAIILVHNRGFNSSRRFGNLSLNNEVPFIDLSEDMIHGYDDLDSTEKQLGLPSNLKLIAGSQFVNALNPDEKFVIGDDGKLYNQDGGFIPFNNESVKILKRVK